MKNIALAQGVISIIAVLCLAAGWFRLFPQDVNTFLSARMFYIFISVSFVLQAQILFDRKFIYAMYGAAALCFIGALLPLESRISGMKTLGLLIGVIVSLSNRSNFRR